MDPANGSDQIRTQVAKFLVGQDFTLAACAFILLLFLVFATALVVGWYRLRAPLREARRKIERVDNPSAFAASFEELSSWFLSQPLLAHQWSEFQKTLVLPPPGRGQIIQNTEPPEHFFNIGSLLGDLDTRLYRNVPGILTGLGILGTFLGLAAGVSLATPGLTAEGGNPQEDLGRLLNGAALAFSTSVVGLLTSLLFGLLEARLGYGLSTSVGRLAAALDARLYFITPQSLAQAQLDQLKEQTTQLQHFNTELALAIAEALDEKIGRRLAPSVDKLIAAVESLRTDQSTDLGKLVETIVTRFERSLSRSFGSELQGMSTGFISSAANLQEATATLSAGQTSFGQQLAQMSQHLGERVDEVGSMLSRLSSAAQASSERQQQQIEQLMERLAVSLTSATQTAAVHLAETTESSTQVLRQVLGEAAEGAARSSEGLRTILAELERGLGSLKAVVNDAGSAQLGFREVTVRLAEAATRAEKLGSALTQAAESSTLLLDSIREQHASLNQTLREYQQRFETVDIHTARLFQALGSNLESYSENVQAYTLEIQKLVDATVDKLSGAIRDLSDTVEELAKRTSR